MGVFLSHSSRSTRELEDKVCAAVLSPVSGNGLPLKRGNSYPPHGLHVNPVLKYYSACFTEVGEVSRGKKLQIYLSLFSYNKQYQLGNA